MNSVEISPANPTARVLRTLELVQSNPGATAADLAGRLEMSERAVRRYIAIMREAGIAIESTRGRYGGYRLGRSLRPAPFVFTASEALGLVMAVLDGHHAAADPHDPVGSALGKLIGSLPVHTARQAARVLAHARAAPDRRAARPDPAITSALVDALAQRRGASIHYTAESGRTLPTDVDPWAIVVRHGRWYLACYSHRPGAPRAYRIDRIDRIEARNVDVEPPDDLDPVPWLDSHLATSWQYPTEVEFDAPIDAIAPCIPAPMGRLEATDCGTRCILTGTTDNPTMYAGEWLAGIPYPFRIIGGDELRCAVAEVGRRMLDSVAPA
jgi:predicted DNA-binding transcriptional regulator YafY